MLRSIIAVTFGVIVGFLIVVFASLIVTQMIPVSSAIDPNDPEVMKKLPFANQLGIVAVWFVGAFAGAGVTSLTGRRWAPSAWVVAATMIIFAMSNLASFPSPMWLVLGAIGAIALGGWLAVKITAAGYGGPPTPPKPGL